MILTKLQEKQILELCDLVKITMDRAPRNLLHQFNDLFMRTLSKIECGSYNAGIKKIWEIGVNRIYETEEIEKTHISRVLRDRFK